MRQITVIANGVIFSEAITIPENEMVIAADGGTRHCFKLGITPDVVIGDFDSLSKEEISTLEKKHIEIIRHPVDKDETDLELALHKALELGATRITLYGLLGGRWDMSFANLLLLAMPHFAGIRFRVVAGKTEAFILRSGETLELQGESEDTVSVVPLNQRIHGLTYDGLQWPLEGATLDFGTPRGVSNRFVNSPAHIHLDDGLLLVFLIHQ